MKTALIGFHNRAYLSNINDLFKRRGYEVTSVGTLDDMLNAMRIIEGKPSNNYDWYAMDTNLGKPGQGDCEPAKTIYLLVEGRVGEGSAHFISLTGAGAAQEAAEREGIPVLDKCDLSTKFLPMISRV
ncbi:MAG: hypothetical protein Q8Q31_04375 [Nanoarchaeota archaeon]|nr:hypothetical protein [Nanoarchaeota archaeon]